MPNEKEAAGCRPYSWGNEMTADLVGANIVRPQISSSVGTVLPDGPSLLRQSNQNEPPWMQYTITM